MSSLTEFNTIKVYIYLVTFMCYIFNLIANIYLLHKNQTFHNNYFSFSVTVSLMISSGIYYFTNLSVSVFPILSGKKLIYNCNLIVTIVEFEEFLIISLLLFIATERYLRIRKNNFYQQYINKKNITFVHFIIWTFTFIHACIISFTKSHENINYCYLEKIQPMTTSIFSVIIGQTIPLIITTILNFLIGYYLVKIKISLNYQKKLMKNDTFKNNDQSIYLNHSSSITNMQNYNLRNQSIHDLNKNRNWTQLENSTTIITFILGFFTFIFLLPLSIHRILFIFCFKYHIIGIYNYLNIEKIALFELITNEIFQKALEILVLYIPK